MRLSWLQPGCISSSKPVRIAGHDICHDELLTAKSCSQRLNCSLQVTVRRRHQRSPPSLHRRPVTLTSPPPTPHAGDDRTHYGRVAVSIALLFGSSRLLDSTPMS